MSIRNEDWENQYSTNSKVIRYHHSHDEDEEYWLIGVMKIKKFKVYW